MSAATLLAWIPFLEPLPAAHRWWWLLIVPLAFGIAMSWKAVRVASLDQFWRDVAMMTGQIILAVAGIAVGLFVLIQIALPVLPN